MWGILINGAFKKRFKDTDFFTNANSKEEKKKKRHLPLAHKRLTAGRECRLNFFTHFIPSVSKNSLFLSRNY